MANQAFWDSWSPTKGHETGSGAAAMAAETAARLTTQQKLALAQEITELVAARTTDWFGARDALFLAFSAHIDTATTIEIFKARQ